MNFGKAAVIGTGMMGPGIAGSLALGGLDAVIISRQPESAAKGLESANSQLRYLADAGLIPEAGAAAAAGRLTATHDLEEAVSGADLVIESAPENMAFKQRLFAQLDAIAGVTTVLASNTSGLSITAIASSCRRPERVVTTHFWNPPHLMPLVEIVKGEKTLDEVATGLRDLLVRCGKTPVIVKKDRPGQLGNRLQMAMIREAINIVQEGIADAEDVDLAAKTGFGLRLPVYGILEHMDMVGLDMAMGIVDYVCADLNNEGRAPELMRRHVANQELGVKTGTGFYDWNQRSADDLRNLRDNWLREFLKTPFAKTPTRPQPN